MLASLSRHLSPHMLAAAAQQQTQPIAEAAPGLRSVPGADPAACAQFFGDHGASPYSLPASPMTLRPSPPPPPCFGHCCQLVFTLKVSARRILACGRFARGRTTRSSPGRPIPDELMHTTGYR